MLTGQRVYEVIQACDGLINSPNVTETGKLKAKIKKEEMLHQLKIWDY